MENERRLVKRIITGNRRACTELVEKYQRLVAHIVYCLVSNPPDREDLCQDVF
jgi:DNA-directed RNA polymerase specialized sigma subunit